MKAKNILLTSALLILVFLVLYKTLGHNHFRNDAGKWAKESVNASNLISSQELNKLPGDKLLIALDTKSATEKSLSVAPNKILEKENFKKISHFEGTVVLMSQKPAESARIWMLLSQMGIKNLYILTI